MALGESLWFCLLQYIIIIIVFCNLSGHLDSADTFADIGLGGRAGSKRPGLTLGVSGQHLGTHKICLRLLGCHPPPIVALLGPGFC